MQWIGGEGKPHAQTISDASSSTLRRPSSFYKCKSHALHHLAIPPLRYCTIVTDNDATKSTTKQPNFPDKEFSRGSLEKDKKNAF